MKQLFDDWIAPLAVLGVIVYIIWYVVHYS